MIDDGGMMFSSAVDSLLFMIGEGGIGGAGIAVFDAAPCVCCR